MHVFNENKGILFSEDKVLFKYSHKNLYMASTHLVSLNTFAYDVGMCACVSTPRLLITSGVIWTPYNWLNKLYSFCIAAVVCIIRRHGLSIEICHRYVICSLWFLDIRISHYSGSNNSNAL